MMIDKFISSRKPFIFILVVSILFINISCSKKSFTGSSAYKSKSTSDKIQEVPETDNQESGSQLPDQSNECQVDNKKLNDFLNSDAEKSLKVGKTSTSEIIKTAKKYLGVPHCMGGLTMKCIDCSGLLVSVFAQHGIILPHSADEQAKYGKKIKEIENLKEGDLVFFTKSYRTSHFITHSGIYIGNNQFIHTSSQSGVTITSLNDKYWNPKFVFGSRIFE